MTDVARMRLAGDVDGLCRAVRRGDDVTAARAAALLGDMGDQRAADTLLDAVRRHDERCRAESLDDDRLWPLREAVCALGRLRVRRAVAPLCRLLDGATLLTGPPAYWVERTVLRALVDVGAPEAADLLLARLAERPDDELLHLLGELAEPSAVVPLLALLWRLAPTNGENAVRALGEFRDARAAPALLYLANVTQSSVGLRRAALTALAKLPDAPWETSARNPGEVERTQLSALLRDPDREIAHLAAELLTRTAHGRHGLYNAVHSAARRYVNCSETACVAACAVVSRQPEVFADEQLLIPELVFLLAAARPRPVRRAAAAALGALGGPEAVEALLTALADARIADTVAGVIGRLREPPLRRLLSLFAQGNPAAATALGVAGHAGAAPRLLAVLTPAVPLALRAAAADALGRLGHRPAVEALSALVADEAEPGRLQAVAVRALGLIGDPGSVPVLLAASRSGTESVRLRAVEALGRYGEPEAVTRLGAMAGEAEPDIAQAAVQALGEVGKPALPTLSALVARAPGWPLPMQRALITALAAVPGPDPVDALGRLSAPPFTPEIRATAAKSLSDRHAPECAAPLLRFMADERTQIWHDVALPGLAATASPAAVDRVIAYFEARRSFRPRHDETLAALSTIAAAMS